MRIDEIPDVLDPASGAEPSEVRRRILGGPSARRTVVKAIATGAVAATLVPFDWMLSRREAVATPPKPGPTSEHKHPRCGGFGQYDPDPNNWPRKGYRACVGGSYTGKYPCNKNKRHFEGLRLRPNGATIRSYRIGDACGDPAKNAWRWTTKGNVYRCSDAETKRTWPNGKKFFGLTIARCYLFKA